MILDLLNFLKIALISFDDVKIEDRLHNDFVVKRKTLSEEQWNEVITRTKFSLGSIKVNYAFTIGNMCKPKYGGWAFSGALLACSVVEYLTLYLIFKNKLNNETVNLLYNALIPVLSAYLVYQSFTLLKQGYNQFSLIIFIIYTLLSFVLIFIIELPVHIVLVVSLFLFLCFTRGGVNNE